MNFVPTRPGKVCNPFSFQTLMVGKKHNKTISKTERNHHHHCFIKPCIHSTITGYLLHDSNATAMLKDFSTRDSVSGDVFGFVLNITDINHAVLVFLITEKKQ